MDQNLSENSNDSSEDDENIKRLEMLTAVYTNNYHQLNELINNSSQSTIVQLVNVKDQENNNSLLHVALNKRKRKYEDTNTNIIRLLVDKGADISYRNNNDETPNDLLVKRARSITTDVNWDSIKDIFSSHTPSCSNNIDEMDYEIISYQLNPTYNASGLKTSIHGSIYQIHLISLIVHRAVKQFNEVTFYAELDEAEKFDDIVLKFQTSPNHYSWRFIQTKHCLNIDEKKIKKSSLFSRTEDQPFMLTKYFESFCKIRNNSFFKNNTSIEFSLCTNAILDSDAQQYFIDDEEFDLDTILFKPNLGIMKYKLNIMKISEIFKELNKKQTISPSTNKNKRKKSIQDRFHLEDHQQYCNEFMEKFRLIVNYPNLSDLNKIIKKELGDEFRLLNSNLLSYSYQNYILQWFIQYKQGKSNVLLVQDGRKILNMLRKNMRVLMTCGLSIAYPEKLASYGLDFIKIPSIFKEFMENIQQILLIDSEAPLLSSIKLHQYLQQSNMYNVKDKLIFLQLDTLESEEILEMVYQSFSSSMTLLILDCSQPKTTDVLNLIIPELLRILRKSSNKKIILINGYINESIPKSVFKDSGWFHYLSDRSQEEVLTRDVILQGSTVKLADMLDGQIAKQIIDSDMLIRLIKSDEIIIDQNDTVEEKLYITRQLIGPLISTEMLKNISSIPMNQFIIIQCDDMKLDEFTNSNIHHVTDNENYQTVVQKLLTKNSTYQVFVIEYRENQLWLEKFYGDTSLLKKYLMDNNGIIREIDLYKSTSKINVITADLGYGKSYLINKFHADLKQLHSNYWIKRVNLSEYVGSSKKFKRLGDIDFTVEDVDKAVEFIADMLFPLDTFQCKLFQSLLSTTTTSTTKIILLFDGFDEICPTYSSQMLTLLRALEQTSIIKICITSRTHVVNQIIEALHVPIWFLQTINHEDRRLYIDLYRETYYKELPQERSIDALNKITLYLKNLKLLTNEEENMTREEALNESIKSDFTDVFLHLWMLVELVFNNRFARVSDVYTLYVEFMMLKFDNYYDNKASLTDSLPADSDIRQRDTDTLTKEHAELSYQNLFPFQAGEHIYSDEYKNKMQRIGFIVLKKDLIQFVHRSFAEYFLTYYINNRIEILEIQTLFFEVVLEEPEYKLTRGFVNKFETFARHIMDTCTNDVLDILLRYKFHIFIIEEHLDNLVEFYFLRMNATKRNYLIEMIGDFSYNYHDWDLRKPHHAIYYQLLQLVIYDIELFKFLLKTCLRSKPNYLCSRLDEISFNPFFILFEHIEDGLHDRLEQIKEIEVRRITEGKNIVQKLTSFCFCGKNVLHIAAERGRFNDIIVLFEFLPIEIREEVILKLLIINFDTCVCEDPEIMFCYFHLNSVGTFIHCMTYNETCIDVLRFIVDNFKDYQIEEFCQITNKNRKSILHHLCSMEVAAMYNFLNIILVTVSTDVVMNILLIKDNAEQTVLHYIKNEESYLCLLQFCFQLFDPSQIKELLWTFDEQENTVIHSILKQPNALALLLNFTRSWTLEDIWQILFKTNSKGRNALHISIMDMETSQSSILILNYTIEVFGREKAKELIWSQDVAGMTILHHSCYNYESNIIKDILNWAKDFMEPTEFQQFALKRDEANNRNILYHSLQSNNNGIFITIVKYFKAIYGDTFVDSIVLEHDDNGQSILHCTGEKVFSIDWLDRLKEVLSLNTLIRFLLKLDNNHRSAYRLLSPMLKYPLASIYKYILKIILQSKPGSQYKIYWTEFEEMSDLLCDSRIRTKEISDGVNRIYNDYPWKEVTPQSEWVLELEQIIPI